MPSPIEYHILVSVLAVVFLSLPLALVLRRLFPQPANDQAVKTTSGVILPPPPPLPWIAPDYDPPADDLWTPPRAELVVALPPDPPLGIGWTRKDAVFAFGLALIVALLMGPVASGPAQGGGGGGADKIEFSAGLFMMQIIFQAGLIGLVLGYLIVHRGYDGGALFGLRRLSALKVAGTALLWIVPAYFIIIMAAAVTLPLLQHLTGIELKQQLLVERATEITDPTARVLMFVTLCIGAPLMEELIFRGVFFSVAAKFIHPVYANVSTSVLFAVIHNNLFSLVPLTLLGMLFAHLYQRTRSLAVPVVMHSIFNCSQFLLLLYGPKDLQ